MRLPVTPRHAIMILVVVMIGFLYIFSGCSQQIQPVETPPPSTDELSSLPSPQVMPSPSPAGDIPEKNINPDSLKKADRENIKTGMELYHDDGSYFGQVVEIDDSGVIVVVDQIRPGGKGISYNTHIDWDNLEKTFHIPGEPAVESSDGEAVNLTNEDLEALIEADKKIDIIPPIPADDEPPLPKEPDSVTPRDHRPSPREEPTTPPAPADYGRDFYELTGVLDMGENRTAILRQGSASHSAKTGDMLPGDWRITAVAKDSVTLSRDGEIRTLTLRRD